MTLLYLKSPYRKKDRKFIPAVDLTFRTVGLVTLYECRQSAVDGVMLTQKCKVRGPDVDGKDSFLWFAKEDGYEFRENRKVSADEEIVGRIETVLDDLRAQTTEMTRNIPSPDRVASKYCVIAAGLGGLSKTYTVESALRAAEPEWREWAQTQDWYEEGMPSWAPAHIHLTAIALYRLLREMSHPGQVVVIDDATIWKNDDVFAVLKAATDIPDIVKPTEATWESFQQRRPRHMTWMTDDDVPSFNYHGSVILITNEPIWRWEHHPHLEPMKTRAYMTSFVFERSEVVVFMAYLARKALSEEDGGIFAGLEGVDAAQVETVIVFLQQNSERFDVLDLRVLRELMQYRLTKGDQWEEVARRRRFKVVDNRKVKRRTK